MQTTKVSKITAQILFEQLQELVPDLRTVDDLKNWSLAGPYMEEHDIYPVFSGFDIGGDCAYLSNLPKMIVRNNLETRLQCSASHPVLAFWTCFLAYKKGILRDHYNIYIQTSPTNFVYT